MCLPCWPCLSRITPPACSACRFLPPKFTDRSNSSVPPGPLSVARCCLRQVDEGEDDDEEGGGGGEKKKLLDANGEEIEDDDEFLREATKRREDQQVLCCALLCCCCRVLLLLGWLRGLRVGVGCCFACTTFFCEACFVQPWVLLDILFLEVGLVDVHHPSSSPFRVCAARSAWGRDPSGGGC